MSAGKLKYRFVEIQRFDGILCSFPSISFKFIGRDLSGMDGSYLCLTLGHDGHVVGFGTASDGSLQQSMRGVAAFGGVGSRLRFGFHFSTRWTYEIRLSCLLSSLLYGKYWGIGRLVSRINRVL